MYVHCNANYRKVPLLVGLANVEGQPLLRVNQRDTYLTVSSLP
jgi:hypothetical protein